jgi:hypothetical protein
MCLGFWWKARRREDVTIGEKMMLKWVFERENSMGRIDLAKDGNQWRTLVNMVMNICFYKLLGNS